jgi:hypothetical protein
MLGYLPESDYPFPLSTAPGLAPERLYCINGAPSLTPHDTFLVSTVNYGVVLSEGAPFGGGPTYRRWWFSAPASNRANIATISNVTARDLEVVLIVQAGQSFNWWGADFEGAGGAFGLDPNIIPRFDVGVLEGSLSSSPQMTYAPFGTDAAVFQVNPTLQATHFWPKNSSVLADTGGTEKNTATQMVMGKLPPLRPGRKYVAEPSIFINGGETDPVADIGTYTAGRMFLGLLAWTIFD